jgi:NodT family efflux transporter outer membrane factor (OMF) lipoprotein
MKIQVKNTVPTKLMLLLAGIAVLMVAGCAAVGPDYVPKDPVAPEGWQAELTEGLAAGQTDPKALARWWTVLNDPVLDGLIERAALGNLDLKQAAGRVREARARRNISQADLFPSLDATGSAAKSRGSEDRGSGQEAELYQLGLDAAWELDIFGGVRRTVEADTADIQASEEDLNDVLVSLLSEVALNYIDLCSFQARLAVAAENLVTQQETYDLTQFRFQAGLATELSVMQARYNLESTRSQIPTLRTGLHASLNRLAVLLGQPPGTLDEKLQEIRPIPVTPPSIVVGVPAETLRRRPDVRRAERQLAAQTARIGVATADLYPQFKLSGSIGLEALSVDNLFQAGSRTYGLGASFLSPIFHAGAIRANIKVQSALQEQALVNYEATVLAALEEVENALNAYAKEQQRRRALFASADAARQASVLADIQYRAGLIDFGDVLDAQRSLLSFQDQLVQSEGTVTANLVRLYKTLGGGWTAQVSQTP